MKLKNEQKIENFNNHLRKNEKKCEQKLNKN